MQLIKLVGLINKLTNKPTYPLEFPYNTKREDVVVIDIINGQISGEITELNFQIMVKSLHPSVAEDLASTLITSLHNKTNIKYEDYQVVLIQARNPNPFYTGQDKNNNYIYIAEFRLLVTN